MHNFRSTICCLYAKNYAQYAKNMQKICRGPNQYEAHSTCKTQKTQKNSVYASHGSNIMKICKICSGGFADVNFPWGSNYSNYSFNFSNSFPFMSSTLSQQCCQLLVIVWCTFHVLNCPHGVQALKLNTVWNHSQSLLFPWFRLWSGCEDSIKLIILLIIPDYSIDYSGFSLSIQLFLWCSNRSRWKTGPAAVPPPPPRAGPLALLLCL